MPEPNDQHWNTSKAVIWPHLTICSDLGPDNLCAINALQRNPEWRANVCMIGDPSHGAHRDLDLALKGANLWKLWVSMMISWNLHHGPDRDDIRYHQVREAMQTMLASDSPHTSTLFAEFCPRIQKDLQSSGVTLPGEQSLEKEIWATFAPGTRAEARACA